jgi:hypothetical protein
LWCHSCRPFYPRKGASMASNVSRHMNDIAIFVTKKVPSRLKMA